jgi:hypothetical protein
MYLLPHVRASYVKKLPSLYTKSNPGALHLNIYSVVDDNIDRRSVTASHCSSTAADIGTEFPILFSPSWQQSSSLSKPFKLHWKWNIPPRILHFRDRLRIFLCMIVIGMHHRLVTAPWEYHGTHWIGPSWHLRHWWPTRVCQLLPA